MYNQAVPVMGYQQPGFPYGMGMQPIPAQYNYVNPIEAMLKIPNPIGKEGFQYLRQKGGGKLNMYVTKEEMLRMLCTHRHDGAFSISLEDPENKIYRCNICDTLIDLGSVFDEETIQKMVNYLTAAFNQMKIKNTGVVTNEIMNDASQAFLFLERFPTMLKIVNTNYKNNQIGAQQVYTGYNQNAQQVMNMITGTGGIPYQPVYQQGMAPILQSQLVTNPFAGPIMPQQPVMGYPQQPVMYPQQQMGYPQQGMVYPQQPVVYPQQQQVVYPQQPVAPPAAAGTVVPEQPVTYPPPQPQTDSNPVQSQPGKITKVFNG